ncbi:hypothetical protein RJP21_16225 [Paenibacillus sp. VCA1]|uniref:hypothetical protein n=1 Tax=Paenibacillus sp. VCA1 TaxID=3039148 RepID=UPI002871E7CC|nr:hypothetical protein [Paenibacillus sp. VCA1]MDR9855165.1 hypothetical protein [Paenibacillus sp. VCA1]
MRLSINKVKTYFLAALCCLIGSSMVLSTAHAEGSASYNYSFWNDTTPAPAAYEAASLLNGVQLGVGPFKNPSDIHVTADKRIYVLDSGNNRIVVLDEQFKQVKVVDSFDHGGKKDTFNNPQGIFVTDRKELFIADTGNKRVVHLDSNLRLSGVLEAPKSDLLQANFDFQPVRVVVDKAQRIYVMSIGVFDGFMEFNSDGAFTSFIGANRVTVDPVELFWKKMSTKAQRSRMVMFTPTEFTNLDIDDEGFIYATSGDYSNNPIKKLNAQGNDILRRTGYLSLVGDTRYSTDVGPSRLIDIDVTDSEMYSVLDSKRGRIFTYSGDGHLMYIFGGLGNQMGQFNTPAAIERVGDDFLVLDKAFGEITVFQTTAYGRMLNEAVRSYYRGDEEKAFDLYQQAINMNANLEFAYSGVGKALLRKGDYKGAMQYFKESYDQVNYSKAYLLYRKQVMREYFPAVMTGLIVLAAALLFFKKLRKRMRRQGGVTIES